MLGVEVRCAFQPCLPWEGVWFGLNLEDCRQPSRTVAVVTLCAYFGCACVEFASKLYFSLAKLLVLGVSLSALGAMLVVAFLSTDKRTRFLSWIGLLTMSFFVIPLINAIIASKAAFSGEVFVAVLLRRCCAGLMSVVFQIIGFGYVSVFVSSFWLVGLLVFVWRFLNVGTSLTNITTFSDILPPAFATIVLVVLAYFLLHANQRARQRILPAHSGDVFASVLGASQEDVETNSLNSIDSITSIDMLFIPEDELPSLSVSLREHRAEFMEWPEYGDALATIRALRTGRRSHTKAYFYRRFVAWKSMQISLSLPSKSGLISERARRLKRLWRRMKLQDRDRDRLSFIIFSFYHSRGRIAYGLVPDNIMLILMAHVAEVGSV